MTIMMSLPVALVAFWLCQYCLGFSPVSIRNKNGGNHRFSSLSATNDNTDREFIRQQLDAVFSKKGDSSNTEIVALLSQVNSTNMDGFQLCDQAPPQTSIERIYREQEIELLKQLSESDGPLTDLRRLWNSERGNMINPDECDEPMLLDTVQENGLYSVQPIHLLAKLYARQGRHLEAHFLWTKIVLPTKPWHVDAQRGVVKACVKLRDCDAARDFAQQSLPDLISSSSSAPFAGGCVNPKRIEWVETHVEKAQKALEDAEKRTVQFFAVEQDDWQ